MDHTCSRVAKVSGSPRSENRLGGIPFPPLPPTQYINPLDSVERSKGQLSRNKGELYSVYTLSLIINFYMNQTWYISLSFESRILSKQRLVDGWAVGWTAYPSNSPKSCFVYLSALLPRPKKISTFITFWQKCIASY